MTNPHSAQPGTSKASAHGLIYTVAELLQASRRMLSWQTSKISNAKTSWRTALCSIRVAQLFGLFLGRCSLFDTFPPAPGYVSTLQQASSRFEMPCWSHARTLTQQCQRTFLPSPRSITFKKTCFKSVTASVATLRHASQSMRLGKVTSIKLSSKAAYTNTHIWPHS